MSDPLVTCTPDETGLEPNDDEYTQECIECHGEGELLVCWDDICQAQGECMHGEDGWATCHVCDGTGYS